jgi:signal transduction histidine kinase
VLSAVAREGEVEIHVTDRGPGFDPEFLGRAFERFSRSGRRRRLDDDPVLIWL